MLLIASGVLAGVLTFQAEVELSKAREKIDAIDARIVDLLNQRASVVAEVGEVKRRAGIPVYAPGREALVVKKAGERAVKSGGPLPAGVVEKIYKALVEQMRQWEAEAVTGR